MAKRRDLKKAINAMCADLMVELMAAQQSNPNIPQDDITNIAESIIMMQEDFTNRLNHVDKRQVDRFFAQMEEDLATTTNDIVDQICHLF